MNWNENGAKEFTPKGYRKRPSYQAIVDMVSSATKKLQVESICKAFKVSGIAANGVNVQDNDLNTRLREALGIASGVVEDNGAHDEEPEDESPEEGNVFPDDDDEEDFIGFDIDTELVLNNDID